MNHNRACVEEIDEEVNHGGTDETRSIFYEGLSFLFSVTPRVQARIAGAYSKSVLQARIASAYSRRILIVQSPELSLHLIVFW